MRLLLVLFCLISLGRPAGAVLQIEVPRDLIDESCRGRVHASIQLEGRAAAFPSTAVAGPDGYPVNYHLLFAYDNVLESTPVLRVDLQVGEELQSWSPPKGSLYYMRGPAFPVSGNFRTAQPCPREAGAATGTRIIAIEPYPCRGSSNVQFSLAQAGTARLRVLNLLGQSLLTLVSQDLSAGLQHCVFHGQGLDNGLYLLVLEAGGARQTSRLLLLR